MAQDNKGNQAESPQSDNTPVIKEESGKEQEGWIGSRLWNTYDHNMLLALGLQYFNQSLTVTMGFQTVQYALKNTYNMQPDQLQYMMTIIAIPWGPKIFYGIITDTFPICGSTKKNYIIFLGFIFALCSGTYALFSFDSPAPVVTLITVAMFASAMSDVVVDGLMVCQQRLDPKNGSEDLQSYSWAIAGIAGIIGNVIGGALTEYGYARQSFYIGAAIAILINISACFLDKKLEMTQTATVQMSLWQRTKYNFGMIKQGLKIKEMYMTFLFVLIQGAIYPNYTDYIYFYLTDPKYAGFSQLTYGIIRTVAFGGMFVGAAAYGLCLKNLSYRTLMIIASIIYFTSSLGNMAFLKGIYFGMSPVVFYSMVQFISDSFIMSFVIMPTMAVVAKIIPPSIESALFAFFTGLGNLNLFFLAKINGNLINLYFKVDKENLQDLWKLFLVQAFLALIPLCCIWMLPTSADIQAVQEQIKLQETQLAEQGNKVEDSPKTDTEANALQAETPIKEEQQPNQIN